MNDIVRSTFKLNLLLVFLIARIHSIIICDDIFTCSARQFASDKNHNNRKTTCKVCESERCGEWTKFSEQKKKQKCKRYKLNLICGVVLCHVQAHCFVLLYDKWIFREFVYKSCSLIDCDNIFMRYRPLSSTTISYSEKTFRSKSSMTTIHGIIDATNCGF